MTVVRWAQVRQRSVGGMLAALCVAAGSCGVLAIALLAPPSGGSGGKELSSRSGWPIGDAFSALGAASRPADEPNTSAVAAPLPAPTETQPAPGAGSSPTAAAAPPARFVAQSSSGLPPPGEATAFGCGAALQYLSAYAAPGFWLVCPGDAQGHQAMTACQSVASPCDLLRIIVIADPCPAAYMNEASNSWALMGASDAPLDPYGFCA